MRARHALTTAALLSSVVASIATNEPTGGGSSGGGGGSVQGTLITTTESESYTVNGHEEVDVIFGIDEGSEDALLDATLEIVLDIRLESDVIVVSFDGPIGNQQTLDPLDLDGCAGPSLTRCRVSYSFRDYIQPDCSQIDAQGRCLERVSYEIVSEGDDPVDVDATYRFHKDIEFPFTSDVYLWAEHL